MVDKMVDEKPFKEFFKDYLIYNAKELIKFSIIGGIIFLVMTMILAYLLVKIFYIDIFVSAVIISIIVSVTIIYIDEKKIHANKKILEKNREMVKRLFKGKL